MQTLYLRVPDELHARVVQEADRNESTLTATGIRLLQEALDQRDVVLDERAARNRGRWETAR